MQVCVVRPERAFALLSVAALPIEVAVVVHHHDPEEIHFEIEQVSTLDFSYPSTIPAEVAHGLATLWTLHFVAAFFLEEPESN